MNRKGFTLVELLAMLVVLGILMGIAIPNISGILTNNKLNVMKADANKMVDTASMKFAKLSRSQKPKDNECVVFTLNYLNDSGDINAGPNGGQYLQFDSFIVVSRESRVGDEGSSYKYYIRLVEQKGSKYLGMDFIERSDLSQGKDNITSEITLGDNQRLSADKQDSMDALNNITKLKEICGEVKDYYPGKVLS